MRHPSNRAERRQARKIARNRRRSYPHLHWRLDSNPRECRDWNRGAKQYFACGNRCGHSRESRYLDHLKVKRLRRTNWAADFI
jgi:hypothetical protein